ncbi:hypothetical protein ACHAXR_004701 [Thalassiosira sp. AJA248-18]
MAPSVETNSAKVTPVIKPSSSPSAVPSLELSEGMATPANPDDVDSGGEGEVVTDKNNNEARAQIMPKSAHSSSSSIWNSDDGVAGGDRDDENNYGYNSAGLKNCWEAVAVNAASLNVKDAGDGGCDDDSENSSDNDESVDGSSSNISSEQRPCENLAQTRDGFKDPFPVLTPIPPTTTRNSLQSRYNRLNVKTSVARDFTVPNIALTQPSLTPMMNSTHRVKNTAQSKRCSFTDFSTPQYNFNAPETPPLTRAGARQPLSVQTSPIRTTAYANNSQKPWIDPFPTPDISVHSMYGTPCSSRIKYDSEDHDDCDGDQHGRVLKADWETILQTIPQIPLIEEFNSSDGAGLRRRSNKSFPHLQSMGSAEPSVRKVFSDSNLPLTKRPSFENIWGALRSGPDGNELVDEYDNGKSEGRKKKARRNSEKSLFLKEPLEYHVSSMQNMPLRRRDQKHVFERSSTAPVEASWKGLQSPLIAVTDDNNRNCNANTQCNGNNNANGHLRNNSSTITNVTGAELAKEVKMLIGNREGTARGAPMTPNRMSFRTIRAVANVKASAGELVFSPVKTVRNAYRTNSRRASTLIKKTREKLEKRKELKRQRRLARMNDPPPSWWIVIPADHPYKIAWDMMTMIWALLGSYRTHVRIRDRVFDQSPLIILTEVLFTVDILLNFVTEHKTSKGQVIRDGKAVWARYLTTWFIIDILSLIPWERIYVRPVVERIKKRNFFQKTFFRSKAVVRVSRVLRGRHIKLFGRVSKQTGTPLRRMVSLIIKYLPKYLVFLRNMKGALVVRALRFVHWLHNMYKKFWVKAKNARENYIARRADRRAARRSMFDPIFGRSAPTDHDSDSDSDDGHDSHSDTDGEDDSDSDTDGDDSEEEEGEREYNAPILRAHSEGMPRRRSFSQG